MAKIKSKCLSLCEKSKVIEEYEKGVSVSALARKYGIAKSTVCSIKNKKSKILAMLGQPLRSSRKCTLKKAEYPKMEKALYKWFRCQRERQARINGNLMKQRAIYYFNKYYTGRFNASDGWFQKFKMRYGVRLLKVCGEKLSSQPELVQPFKRKLENKIHELNLCDHQLYNADETGLYWQLLPDKTYVSLDEKSAPGMKSAKQRITFLGCANASGSHKLRPLVIGKAKNPRCFKNFNNPVIYTNTKNAWMTAAVFKTWFFDNFVPEV